MQLGGRLKRKRRCHLHGRFRINFSKEYLKIQTAEHPPESILCPPNKSEANTHIHTHTRVRERKDK
jgi:hypothetical protein